MEMIMVICDRTLTNKIVKLLEKQNMKGYYSFYGRGTASSEILSYFGLAKSEKEVILSFAEKKDTDKMIANLKEQSYVLNQGAVAFCTPIDAVNKRILDLVQEKWG